MEGFLQKEIETAKSEHIKAMMESDKAKKEFAEQIRNGLGEDMINDLRNPDVRHGERIKRKRKSFFEFIGNLFS